jgi:hypothetical protein
MAHVQADKHREKQEGALQILFNDLLKKSFQANFSQTKQKATATELCFLSQLI